MKIAHQTWQDVQSTAESRAPRTSRGAERHRQKDDDFFCVRFSVWYPSIDCAFRTRYRTSPSCLDCEQGRFNLKRHADSLSGSAFHRPV